MSENTLNLVEHAWCEALDDLAFTSNDIQSMHQKELRGTIKLKLMGPTYFPKHYGQDNAYVNQQHKIKNQLLYKQQKKELCLKHIIPTNGKNAIEQAVSAPAPMKKQNSVVDGMDIRCLFSTAHGQLFAESSGINRQQIFYVAKIVVIGSSDFDSSEDSTT